MINIKNNANTKHTQTNTQPPVNVTSLTGTLSSIDYSTIGNAGNQYEEQTRLFFNQLTYKRLQHNQRRYS